jgi:AcrR family transcriptional regulator
MSVRVSDDTILDAVVATVVAHGYTGATTRQIATTASVNEVTLFRRFANKESLVQAAIHRDLARITNPDLQPSGDLEADLLAVLDYFVALYRQPTSLPLVLILEAVRNPELEDLLRQPLALQTKLRALIATYQQSGQLIDEPPADAVNALIGPLLAYGVDAQLGIASPTGPPHPRQLLDRFLGGHGQAREATDG